jgi:hypothetical protein
VACAIRTLPLSRTLLPARICNSGWLPGIIISRLVIVLVEGLTSVGISTLPLSAVIRVFDG